MPESPSSKPIGHPVSPRLPVPNLIETGTRINEIRPAPPESRAANSLHLVTQKPKNNLEQISKLQNQFIKIKKDFSRLMALTRIIGSLKPSEKDTGKYSVTLNSKELALLKKTINIDKKNIEKNGLKKFTVHLKLKNIISIDTYIKNNLQVLKSENNSKDVKKYLNKHITCFSIIHNLCCLKLAFKSPQYIYEKSGLNDSPPVFISLISNDILDKQGLNAGKLIRKNAYEINLNDFFLMTRIDSVEEIRKAIKKDLVSVLNEYNHFKASVDACFRQPVIQDDENRIHNNMPDDCGR